MAGREISKPPQRRDASVLVKAIDARGVTFADDMAPNFHARRHFAIFDSERLISKFELADLFGYRHIRIDPVNRGTNRSAKLRIGLQGIEIIFHILRTRPFERPFGIWNDKANNIRPLVP